MQNKPKLTIPCENLKPGKTLTFELQVFNANNRYQSSQTASIVVVVEDRDIPQVKVHFFFCFSKLIKAILFCLKRKKFSEVVIFLIVSYIKDFTIQIIIVFLIYIFSKIYKFNFGK